MNKHVFAFYHKHLSSQTKLLHQGELFSYKDATLWNRLIRVVRLQPGDSFILFDQEINVTLQATPETIENKRIISGIIQTKEKNRSIDPSITLLLPILKKEAFEYALYAATQMGVQTIQPVISNKSQTALPTSFDRIKSIMVAACEQSKQFIAPEIKDPLVLSQALELCDTSQKIWFDEHGSSLNTLLTNYPHEQAITLILGPEGGFTAEEQQAISKKDFAAYRLTPTILRSREALCVGLGIVRSLQHE